MLTSGDTAGLLILMVCVLAALWRSTGFQLSTSVTTHEFSYRPFVFTLCFRPFLLVDENGGQGTDARKTHVISNQTDTAVSDAHLF